MGIMMLLKLSAIAGLFCSGMAARAARMDPCRVRGDAEEHAIQATEAKNVAPGQYLLKVFKDVKYYRTVPKTREQWANYPTRSESNVNPRVGLGLPVWEVLKGAHHVVINKFGRMAFYRFGAEEPWKKIHNRREFNNYHGNVFVGPCQLFRGWFETAEDLETLNQN